MAARAPSEPPARSAQAVGSISHSTLRTPLPVLLAPVAEVSAADGTVVVHSQVNGTLEAPAVRGEATLAKGSVVVRALPEPIRDINARVVAVASTIRLQEATAMYGGGRLSATGEAALAGRALGAYRLRLTARDLPLRPFEGLDTIWNADLDLANVQGRALLAGEARLVRGLYARDLFTLSALTAPAPASRAEGGPGLPLRIRVRLDDNMVVRTPQSRLIVGGTLNVQGTTTAPVVLGALEAREGTALLRGNRYQIERAIVRFADPQRIDPLLDVAATTRIREYEVTMRVTGRVRDLDIRLSSSPPLPRDELMSLVAFGNTRGEGAGGALAGEAARLLANELLDLSGNDRGPPGPLQGIMERTRVSYYPQHRGHRPLWPSGGVRGRRPVPGVGGENQSRLLRHRRGGAPALPMSARALVALAVATMLGLLGPSPAGAAAPVVTAIDLVSPQQLPRDQVLAAIGPLTGQPRSRVRSPREPGSPVGAWSLRRRHGGRARGRRRGEAGLPRCAAAPGSRA